MTCSSWQTTYLIIKQRQGLDFRGSYINSRDSVSGAYYYSDNKDYLCDPFWSFLGNTCTKLQHPL